MSDPDRFERFLVAVQIALLLVVAVCAVGFAVAVSS